MPKLSWVEISRTALLHNVEQFRKILYKTSLMAVVKSNAYGHDYLLVARTIQSQVDSFGVASGEEALNLRAGKIRKPILVLNYYDLATVRDLVQNNITLVVYSIAQARAISAAAKKLGKQAKVHVKIGTGLSRLGVPGIDAVKFFQTIGKLPNLKIEGMFSHFASSEDDPGFTAIQLNHFLNIAQELEKKSIRVPVKHIACTASALSFPESRQDLVRIGIGLYGLQSYKSIHSQVRKVNPKFALKPVLSWKAKVLAVKDLPAGAYVGYGRTYRAPKKMKLAILPVGYYEGYDRKFSNLAEVLIGGKRCRVRGRVYMNLVSVDVSRVKNVKIGDEAVLLGRQGREEVYADELANIAATINYEIVTRINPLIPRILV